MLTRSRNQKSLTTARLRKSEARQSPGKFVVPARHLPIQESESGIVTENSIQRRQAQFGCEVWASEAVRLQTLKGSPENAVAVAEDSLLVWASSRYDSSDKDLRISPIAALDFRLCE